MNLPENPGIILAGSVGSSQLTLEKLVEHGLQVRAVLGLHPSRSGPVSSYHDLKKVALRHGLPFRYFKKINDPDMVAYIRDQAPDLLFVVGLSQLVKKELLEIPTCGCVGFHPTQLPEGRGRAAIAWTILGRAKPAASFFMMDEGADSGPLLAQVAVQMTGKEYARDLIRLIHAAMKEALDGVLPEIREGKLPLTVQDDSLATYLKKRNPEDGLLDWKRPAVELDRLIRAVSEPYPGAFTFHKDRKLMVWRCRVEADMAQGGQMEGSRRRERITQGQITQGRITQGRITQGRILQVDAEKLLVQTGDVPLNLLEIEGVPRHELKVGDILGMDQKIWI